MVFPRQARVVRPRRPPEPTSDPSLALQAGPCIEVWSPDGAWPEASLRYRAARRAWNDEHGIVGPVRAGTPWSFHWLREQYGETFLADVLASRGLPVDWRPVPVG